VADAPQPSEYLARALEEHLAVEASLDGAHRETARAMGAEAKLARLRPGQPGDQAAFQAASWELAESLRGALRAFIEASEAAYEASVQVGKALSEHLDYPGLRELLGDLYDDTGAGSTCESE
jgi:hypothetical protein